MSDSIGEINGVNFMDTLDHGDPPGNIHQVSGYEPIQMVQIEPPTPAIDLKNTLG